MEQNDEPQVAVLNGVEHEVCGDCGSVVGHGCPTAQPCEPDRACQKED